MSNLLDKIELYFAENFMEEAIINDDLEVIKYFISLGIKLPEDAMDLAIKHEHLKMAKYFHSIGEEYTYTPSFMHLASKNGDLELVKHLHEKDVCIANAMDYAAFYGHLEVLKYLYEEVGAEFTTDAMDWAAENGQLEALEYLHSIGAKCTEDAVKMAYKNGELEILKFLYSINVKFPAEIMNKIDKYDLQFEIIKFLKSIKK